MANEPRLSFSANGSGVALHTKYGGLNFTADEFNHYQSLFKVADNNNLGKLLLGGTQLNQLLMRTGIQWKFIEKALMVVKSENDSELPGIQFNQWLILCKLLAYYQETKRLPSEKIFKEIHKTAIRIPVAEFNLTKAIPRFSSGEYYKIYTAEITGWQQYGEEYQNHHIKFKISTTAVLINNSEMESSVTQDRNVVERRYSDFESLAGILRRNYKGVVIPPLPPKNNWAFPLSASASDSQSTLGQRRRELQLFLDDVTRHPVLCHCYELRSFLECSSPGFKSFVELHAHLASAESGRSDSADADSHSASSSSSGVGKILSDGASAISSLWGFVSKNVFPSRPSAHSESREDTALFGRAAQFLEVLAKLGERMEHLVALEAANTQELAKLGQYFKNMSEFEPIPDLVRTLQLTHEGLGDLTRNQAEQLGRLAIETQTPVVYSGRYLQSYRSAVDQRRAAIEALRVAERRELESKRTVDALAAAVSSPSATASSAVPPSEDLLNQAKLDLARSEDGFEAAKETEGAVTGRLRSECQLLESSQTRRILDHLVDFARASAESCHANAVHWQALRDMLNSKSSDSSGSHSGHSSQSGHSNSGRHSPEPVDGAAGDVVAAPVDVAPPLTTEARAARTKANKKEAAVDSDPGAERSVEKVDSPPPPLSTEVVFPAAVAGRKGKKRTGSQGSR